MGEVVDITNYIGGRKMKELKDKHIKIEALAEEIFNDYDLSIPVDPVNLAKQQNISVFARSFKILNDEKVLGAIKKENGSYKIFVDKKDPINRQRFTIAHELGHYFLQHLKTSDELVSLYRSDGLGRDKVEKEADYFAGCILMNKYFVKKNFEILKDMGSDSRGIISELAQIFKVSQLAMRVRLKELKLIT